MNIPSPYTPRTQTPPVLAGRDAGLRWFNNDLHLIKEQGHTNTPAHVVIGPERMGKSALLHSFDRAAVGANFAVIRAVALPGDNVASLVSQEIAFDRPDPRARVSALTGGAFGFRGAVGLDLPARREPGTELELRRQLAEETSKVGRKRRGVVILVDAAHHADPESFHGLTDAVLRNRQSSAANGAKVLLVVAGDQRLEQQLITAQAGGPYQWHGLGRLNRDSTLQALAGPAHQAGVNWDQQALRSAADLTEGYPQWIQAYGDAIWHNSHGSLITMDAVHQGARAIGPDMVRDFEQVWHRTDSLDRDVMTTVAQVGGSRGVTELANDLQLSQADARGLVNRSLRNESLHSLGQDMVTLPRPHMGNWIRLTQQPLTEIGREFQSIAQFREARAAVAAGRAAPPPIRPAQGATRPVPVRATPPPPGPGTGKATSPGSPIR